VNTFKEISNAHKFQIYSKHKLEFNTSTVCFSVKNCWCHLTYGDKVLSFHAYSLKFNVFQKFFKLPTLIKKRNSSTTLWAILLTTCFGAVKIYL